MHDRRSAYLRRPSTTSTPEQTKEDNPTATEKPPRSTTENPTLVHKKNRPDTETSEQGQRIPKKSKKEEEIKKEEIPPPPILTIPTIPPYIPSICDELEKILVLDHKNIVDLKNESLEASEEGGIAEQSFGKKATEFKSKYDEILLHIGAYADNDKIRIEEITEVAHRMITDMNITEETHTNDKDTADVINVLQPNFSINSYFSFSLTNKRLPRIPNNVEAFSRLEEAHRSYFLGRKDNRLLRRAVLHCDRWAIRRYSSRAQEYSGQVPFSMVHSLLIDKPSTAKTIFLLGVAVLIRNQTHRTGNLSDNEIRLETDCNTLIHFNSRTEEEISQASRNITSKVVSNNSRFIQPMQPYHKIIANILDLDHIKVRFDNWRILHLIHNNISENIFLYGCSALFRNILESFTIDKKTNSLSKNEYSACLHQAKLNKELNIDQIHQTLNITTTNKRIIEEDYRDVCSMLSSVLHAGDERQKDEHLADGGLRYKNEERIINEETIKGFRSISVWEILNLCIIIFADCTERSLLPTYDRVFHTNSQLFFDEIDKTIDRMLIIVSDLDMGYSINKHNPQIISSPKETTRKSLQCVIYNEIEHILDRMISIRF